MNVYVGLYDKKNVGRRAPLPGADGQHRILAGRLHLKPAIRFERVAAAPQPSRGAFTRSDGWARGMHPTDVFLKNTQEVLGPLHAATAHERLTKLEFLTPDRAVRRAVYGSGKEATTVVVNFGRADAEVRSKLGGKVVLPPWGFVIDAPRFAAFYAKRWGGRDYPDGALFTLGALGDQPLERSRRVRVFHGFGGPTIRWQSKDHAVPRELEVQR